MFDGSLVEVTPRPAPIGETVAVEVVWRRRVAAGALPRRVLGDGTNGFVQHPRLQESVWRTTVHLGPGADAVTPAGTLPDGRPVVLRVRRRASPGR